MAAERLRRCVREVDTCARLGGDEFAILLENMADPKGAAKVAERVLAALHAPFPLDQGEALVGVSVGIAYAAPGDDAEVVLRNADLTMYVAKKEGKGAFRVFKPEMHRRLLERLELEAELRAALDRNQFQLHYQPLVCLGTGRITGAEALIRWAHPERGLLSPADFIPMAEDLGLIVPIGRWVLEQACCEARRWQDRFPAAGPLPVTVNLSGRQVALPGLVEHVRSVLNASGLPPELLVLELTESVLIQNTDGTMERLESLREIGIELAIDDFGTGYSSLSYLQKFPIDILKVDRTFVREAGTDAESPLAAAIVQLGMGLKLQVVAEGIEDEQQWARMRQLGCQRGQGFHFSRPVPAPQINELIAAMARGDALPWQQARLPAAAAA